MSTHRVSGNLKPRCLFAACKVCVIVGLYHCILDVYMHTAAFNQTGDNEFNNACRMGGPNGRNEWEDQMGGPNGRNEWEDQMGGPNGRNEWEEQMGGPNGRNEWEDQMGGPNGRNEWEDQMGGTSGRTK